MFVLQTSALEFHVHYLSITAAYNNSLIHNNASITGYLQLFAKDLFSFANMSTNYQATLTSYHQ